MAIVSDIEDIAIGAVGVILIVLIVWLVLAIKGIKIPGLPNFSELLDKLLNALKLHAANGDGSHVLPENDAAGEGFDIRTGIEG